MKTFIYEGLIMLNHGKINNIIEIITYDIFYAIFVFTLIEGVF